MKKASIHRGEAFFMLIRQAFPMRKSASLVVFSKQHKSQIICHDLAFHLLPSASG